MLETGGLRLLGATILVALTAAPVGAPAARAGWLAGQPVDGPSPDIVALGGADLARDGIGGIVYLRNADGAAHVYAAQLYRGRLGPPQRVDPGLTAPSSQPRIAASGDGRLVVAFVNGGSLYGAVCLDKTKPFGLPSLIERGSPEDPILNPALDVSAHGVGYVAYAAPGAGGHDVELARVGLGSAAWHRIDGVADVNPGHDAGTGRGRPAVAASADGTALVAWGEAGGVPLRRVGRKRLSSEAIGATDAALDHHPPGVGDSPQVALQDSSAWGYVVLRQSFGEDGGGSNTHLIGRRLAGDSLGPPQAFGGIGFPAPEGAHAPVLAMDGRGRGMAGGSRDASQVAVSALLRSDAFADPTPMNGQDGIDPDVQMAAGEDETGVVAWFEQAPLSAPTVQARLTANNAFQDPVVLSSPALGAVDPGLGLAAAADRRSDALIAFIQGPPAERRLVAGIYDGLPGHATPRTPRRVPTALPPLLRWSPAVDLMGPVTYRVVLDGRMLTATGGTSVRVPAALARRTHHWRVDVTDLRGQTRRGKTRRLTVDAPTPEARPPAAPPTNPGA